MTQKFICYPSTNFYVYNLDGHDMTSLKKFIELKEKNIYGTYSKIDDFDKGDIFFIYEKGKNSGFTGICKISYTSNDTPSEKYNIFNDKNKNIRYVCASDVINFEDHIRLLHISDKLKKNMEFKSSASFSNRFIKKSSEFVEMSHTFGKTLLFTLQNENNKNNEVIIVKNTKRKQNSIDSENDSISINDNSSDNQSKSKTNSDKSNSESNNGSGSDNSDDDSDSDDSDSDSSDSDGSDSDDSDSDDSDNESDSNNLNSATESYGNIYESDESTSESESESSNDNNINIPILFDPCKKFIKTDNGIKFRKALCEHVIGCTKCKLTNNNKMELFNEYVLNDCHMVMHDNNTNIFKIKNGYHNLESYFITPNGVKNRKFVMDVVQVSNDKIYNKCYFLCLHEKITK